MYNISIFYFTFYLFGSAYVPNAPPLPTGLVSSSCGGSGAPPCSVAWNSSRHSGFCNSFYCLGHSKNVYDDDDDDDGAAVGLLRAL